MFKSARQIILNLLVILIVEDLVRWGVRIVREQFTGRRPRSAA